MNINFGLFPPLEFRRVDENGKKIKKLRGKERRAAYAARARDALSGWTL